MNFKCILLGHYYTYEVKKIDGYIYDNKCIRCGKWTVSRLRKGS